jgi:hypothetical protein
MRRASQYAHKPQPVAFDFHKPLKVRNVTVAQFHGDSHHFFDLIGIDFLWLDDPVREYQTDPLNPLLRPCIRRFSGSVQEQILSRVRRELGKLGLSLPPRSPPHGRPESGHNVDRIGGEKRRKPSNSSRRC